MVAEPRTFTLEEARRTLPLVRQIASELQQVVNTLTEIPGGTSFLYGATPLDDLVQNHQARAGELQGQIEALSSELTEIGVQVKGYQPVLVDFLSWRDEEMVYLCWAEGEEDVLHWHGLSEGFRGRHPL